MSAGCTWCGGSPLTREHVLPQWLARVLADAFPAEDGYDVASICTTVEGQGPPRTYTAPTPELVVKAVCKSCNTGWMSSLESEVRPFLEPMVRGESVQLDEGRQLALAHWAAKVAVLLEHYEDGITVLGARDLEQIVGGHAPISFHIRLALRTEDHPSPFRLYLTSHFAAPVGTTKDQADTRREANSFSATLGLGRVAVSVIGGTAVDNPDRWRSDGEFPLMIWPPTPGHISWPPQWPVLPTREALQQFHEGFWKRIVNDDFPRPEAPRRRDQVPE
jgi:hypothetical protein